MGIKTCGHCKRGEVLGVPATVMVRGQNRDGRGVGKAYLCEDHLEVETEDGAKYRVVRLQAKPANMDALTRKYTGYGTFAQLCLNNPTLRAENGADERDVREINTLRNAYKAAVGHAAFA
jgi:hypothetical protein